MTRMYEENEKHPRRLERCIGFDYRQFSRFQHCGIYFAILCNTESDLTKNQTQSRIYLNLNPFLPPPRPPLPKKSAGGCLGGEGEGEVETGTRKDDDLPQRNGGP